MSSAGDDNEAFRSVQVGEDPPRVVNRCIGIRLPVNEEHRYRDANRSARRVDGVDVEVALLLGKPKGATDDHRREEERGTFDGDRAQIGECLCCDHGSNPFVHRRLLNRHRGPERRAHQDDWTGFEGVYDSAQVPLFEETIRADVSIRLAVSAAVVGHDIETASAEALDHPDGTCSVVGNAMKIHKHAPPVTGGVASPALESNALTGKDGIVTALRRRSDHPPPGRMEQAACSQRGQLCDGDAAGYRQENGQG